MTLDKSGSDGRIAPEATGAPNRDAQGAIPARAHRGHAATPMPGPISDARSAAARTASGRRSRGKFPSAPPRRRLTVEQRRAELLEAGRLLFTRQRYDDVSTEDIARAAGVSHGLLFHYFPSKVAFYAECLRDGSRALLAEMFATEPGADIVWEHVFDVYFDHLEVRGWEFVLLLTGELSIAPEVTGVVAEFRAEIARRLEAGLPPCPAGHEALLRFAIRSWQGGMEAAILDWLAHDDIDRTHLKQHGVRSLWAALAPVYA